MKKSLLFFTCLLLVVAACQNKKYDPQSYETESSEKDLSNEAMSSKQLWDECQIFMNYCDRNHTANLKVFARDWIRTWKGWETDGVEEFDSGSLCQIETKSRYNHEFIHLSVDTDENPPIFNATRYFFSTEYDVLVNVIKQKLGNPDEEKEIEKGTIYTWHINDVKTISIVPEGKFVLEYILTN